jgi:hypothetical protein
VLEHVSVFDDCEVDRWDQSGKGCQPPPEPVE